MASGDNQKTVVIEGEINPLPRWISNNPHQLVEPEQIVFKRIIKKDEKILEAQEKNKHKTKPIIIQPSYPLELQLIPEVLTFEIYDKPVSKKLTSYFGSEGLEYNLIRVPIGGADFSTHPYTYNEYPWHDSALSNYSLTDEDLFYKVITGISGVDIGVLELN